MAISHLQKLMPTYQWPEMMEILSSGSCVSTIIWQHIFCFNKTPGEKAR